MEEGQNSGRVGWTEGRGGYVGEVCRWSVGVRMGESERIGETVRWRDEKESVKGGDRSEG